MEFSRPVGLLESERDGVVKVTERERRKNMRMEAAPIQIWAW